MISFLIIGVVLPGILLTAIVLIGGKKLIQRRKPSPAASPANYDLPYEDVSFISRYKVTLRGWWIPADNARGTVIFCHGHAGSMDADLPQAVPLHQAGYNVLMYNQRAHGSSDGEAVTFGVFEKEDLLGAVDFLQAAKGVDTVAVLGMSMGASVALITAALTNKIDTLILDSIFERFLTAVQAAMRWRRIPKPFDWFTAQLVVLGATLLTNTRMYQVSPLLWAKHLDAHIPVLFIHNEHEHFVSLDGIKRLAADLKGEHKIWVAPDCQHHQAFRKHPDAYNAEVLAWLEKYHNTKN